MKFLTGSKEFKDRKVKLRFKEDIEPHEIFLDKLAQAKEAEIGISEKKFEVPLSKKTFQILLFVSVILILILFIRSFQFQIIQAKELSFLAEKNKILLYQTRAVRGVIYDKDFNQLVFNQQRFDLVCKKQYLPQDNEERINALKEISKITNKNFEDLDAEIKNHKSSNPLVILKNIDHKTLILFKTNPVLSLKQQSGFQIRRQAVRNYFEGADFSHLIGYTNKLNNIGQSGLEKSYESLLKETPGVVQVERDARNNLISEKIVSLPKPGKSLVLFLDSELQKKIKEEISKMAAAVGENKAAAVALDPRTGGVLALVNIPDFNNNLFSQGISQEDWDKLSKDPLKPLLNRAISGQYLMGSTIKPLEAAAVLEEKLISPEDKILCKGLISIPNPWDTEHPSEYHDWKIHGLTDMRKAIAESCNVYFYIMGGGYKDFQGLGAARIKKYLSLFGWGQKTGIDLPGEEEGFIPDKEWKERYFENKADKIWRIGDTYNLSIGQGYITATPLQIASAYMAIANNGTIYQPRVVEKIIDSSTHVVTEEVEPRIIRKNFISPENLQIVREGMRQAVSSINGSAHILNTLPVKAAAKTGTAQLLKPGYYHNWVTVFAPYENPQIVLTILIENVKGMKPAAVPVAKQVLDWYFKDH